jgi:hypothetical protein
MKKIDSYLTSLITYWGANGVNELSLVNYPTIADLNTYIASDTYLFPDEGVCFGISVELDSNGEYNAQLIFDDQT